MSDQGAPSQQRPEDGWWHSVYAGPAGTLPDTPHAGAGTGTVDDWFDSAAGMIGSQRTAEPAVEAATEDALGDTSTVDDWFDSAVGMIGAQRTAEQDAEPVLADALDDSSSVDDWFDSASGMIAAQRTHEPAHEQPPAEAESTPSPDADADTDAAKLDTPALEPELPTAESEPPSADAGFPIAEPEAPSADAELPSAEAEPPSADAELLAVQPEPPAVQPEPPAAESEPPALEPDPPTAEAPPPAQPLRRPRTDIPVVPHVGERPPTYGPEPTAVPAADPEALTTLAPDTAVEGAQYGTATLRAVSVRGDSARFRGEPRRDALLVTRFGEGEEALLLAVLASPGRSESAADGSAAAAEAARQLAAAIGHSRTELSDDLRAGARDRLRYGLQRLTARAGVPLRTAAEAEGVPEAVPGALHCLLVSLDPAATHRAAFGIGPGGLYLLRSGHWIDAYAARLLHHPDGQPPLPQSPAAAERPFRFRLVPATPGDILLLCTPGLAEPIAEEPAVAHFLANHWAHPHPPGTVDFLRQVQVRAKGYADDRTAAALWTE